MTFEYVQRWAAARADIFGVAAIASAIFLSLAMLMPNWLARTSWSQGSRNTVTTIVDSPASYVSQLSLCGLVALVALTIGWWRRRPLAAALATGAFGYGALVAGISRLSVSRGEALLDGRPVTEMVPPEWTVHSAPLLPVFLLAAIACTISAIALAIAWRRLLAD